jgi:hypothetical protein
VLGPLALLAARSEFLRESFVIEPFHGSVDPAEADRFFDGIIVWDPRPSRVLFEVDQPDFFLFIMILRKPCPPIIPVRYIERFIHFHNQTPSSIVPSGR